MRKEKKRKEEEKKKKYTVKSKKNRAFSTRAFSHIGRFRLYSNYWSSTLAFVSFTFCWVSVILWCLSVYTKNPS